MNMKIFLSFLCILLLIGGAAPRAYAQPPIKKIFQTIGQRFSKKLNPIQAQIKKVLSRKTNSAAKKSPYIFTSLEETSAYYAHMRRVPPFPLPQQKDEIYRGMALNASGQELRHILKNGLEVSKTHSLNFSAYDGKQYPDYQKAIYATPQLPLALTFALNDVRFDKHIPVIIHLKRVSDNRITSIPHDVPVSWIRRVSALLTINGYTLWGEIRLTQDDKFLFIPYLPRAAAQEELGK